MKKYYLFAGLVLLAASPAFAQVKIGSTGPLDGSAMLEVTSGASSNKGLLLPRLTTIQRNAISAPATGLMIYNTTADEVQANSGTPVSPIWSTAVATATGWNVTGNAGTNPTTNFIGTTDNQPLVIRTNNTDAMRVTATGYVGIGSASPTARLEVSDTGDTYIRVGSSNGGRSVVNLGTNNNYHGIARNLTNSGGGANDVALYTSSSFTTPHDATLYLSTNPTPSDVVSLTQFALKDNGYIGMGTSTPIVKLQIADTGDVTMRIGNLANGGSRGHLQLGNDNHGVMRDLTSSGGGANDVALFTSSGGPAANLYLVANPVANGSDSLPLNQFVLNTSGNVGIGTGTPAQTLDVAGTARITGSTGTPTTITGRNTSGDVSSVILGTGLTLTGGTLSVAAGGNNWGITGNAGTTPVTNFIGTTDNQPLAIRTNSTEAVRITAAGYVGIGSAAPAAKLEVADTGDTYIRVGSTNGGRMAVNLGTNNNYHGIVRNLTYTGGGVNDVALYTGSGIGTPGSIYLAANPTSTDTLSLNQFVLKNTGNVGIGTNNPHNLVDLGTTIGSSITDSAGKKLALFNNATGTNFYGLGVSGSTLQFHAGSGSVGAPSMVLLSNGSVGIGTTAPAYALHVVGDINASANVRANGVVLTSDARLKRNITNSGYGLNTIMNLRPVVYDKKNSIQETNYDRHEIGFIAQEIAKVLPFIVTEGKDADKTLAVSYTELIPVLTKAIQEQQAEIAALKAELTTVKTDNTTLKADASKITYLAERMKQLEALLGTTTTDGATASK